MKSITEYLRKPWPYWVGGVLLGILNVMLLAVTGTAWQITSSFLLWAGGILEKFGLQPFKWDYFNYIMPEYKSIIANHNVFINQFSILNIGVIVGSLIATLLASEFKFKKIKGIKHAVFALIGGIMMGYGSRLTNGCTVGSFFDGIPSFSLHAWVFWIFVVLGAMAGTKILMKFLL